MGKKQVLTCKIKLLRDSDKGLKVGETADLVIFVIFVMVRR